MICDQIFATNVWHSHLEIDNAPIKEYCLNSKEFYGGVDISNVGGWHSVQDIIFRKELSIVKDQMITKVFEVATSINLKQEMQLSLEEGWVNINNLNDYNNWHTHPYSFLSCVYYVDSDGSSAIKFEDPRVVRTQFEIKQFYENFDNGDSYEYYPVSGDILIFPSWLKHMVTPNLANKERISIAANFYLHKK